MTEEKTYWLGYNRYSKSIIVYSNATDADRGGGWWREVKALTLKLAKEKFMELYNTEN
jgi:hypothetical protein